MYLKILLMIILLVPYSYGANESSKKSKKVEIQQVGTIEGEAFVKDTVDYNIRTCAGEFVFLYSLQDFEIAKKELKESKSLGVMNTLPKPIATTRCDKDGGFKFNKVNFGKYGVVTRVIYKKGKYFGGGYMANETEVGNDASKIILDRIALFPRLED